jgi:hypothetical protein
VLKVWVGCFLKGFCVVGFFAKRRFLCFTFFSLVLCLNLVSAAATVDGSDVVLELEIPLSDDNAGLRNEVFFGGHVPEELLLDGVVVQPGSGVYVDDHRPEESDYQFGLYKKSDLEIAGIASHLTGLLGFAVTSGDAIGYGHEMEALALGFRVAGRVVDAALENEDENFKKYFFPILLIKAVEELAGLGCPVESPETPFYRYLCKGRFVRGSTYMDYWDRLFSFGGAMAREFLRALTCSIVKKKFKNRSVLKRIVRLLLNQAGSMLGSSAEVRIFSFLYSGGVSRMVPYRNHLYFWPLHFDIFWTNLFVETLAMFVGAGVYPEVQTKLDDSLPLPGS